MGCLSIQEPDRAFVLLSGGIDSSACLAFYLESGFKTEGIHVRYGQPAAPWEGAAARAVAQHYNVVLRTLTWEGSTSPQVGLIAARNAFLLSAGLLEVGKCCRCILAVGIHSGTPYPDCTPEFVSLMQGVFDLYTKGVVRVGNPFLSWSKEEIWHFCRSRKVPIELTYSCEVGGDQACGACPSCVDREALNAEP